MSGNLFKRAKILATIGPASDSYQTIEQLIRAGVNGCRLNCSHGTNDERDRQIEWIRMASKVVGKPVAIVQDLQGPKIRLGDLKADHTVVVGDELDLVHEGEHRGNEIPTQYNLAEKVKPGEPLYIFDGKVRTTVLQASGTTVSVRVENDGVLKSRKGINLPKTNFGGDILTKKDLADIEHGLGQDIDFVAISFIQSARDVKKVTKLLRQKGSSALVIAKIETAAAARFPELEKIVQCSDGVMVARGDMATEIGPEKVPMVQRKILELCQKYGKLSIVATQMMASMVESAEPTRAEVNDIAQAVITGADCLMLSEETAVGKYPVQTIETMKRVILYTQQHAPVRPLFLREGYVNMQDAISSAAVTLATQLEVSAIIAETKSGRTAASIASHRPSLPIISMTSDPRVAQQLALLYANKSFLRPDDPKAASHLATELKERGFFGVDPAIVVVVSGKQPGLIGGTDTIKVRILK